MNQRTGLYWKAPALCLAMTAASFAATANIDPLASEHYRYDASGNMTEKTVNHQTTHMAYSGNRLMSKSSGTQKEAYTYDNAGRPSNLGETARNATYGYADRVLSTESAGKKTEFLYNAEGSLVAKSTGGEAASYTWDGIALAAHDGAVFTNEKHIAGGVPLIQNGESLIISDFLGTTLRKAETQHISSAYGEGQEDGRFTCKVFIKELCSFIFPARLYSAETARWTNADPAGFPNGENNTVYVNNDPLSRLDPLGLTFNLWPVNGELTNATNTCGGSGVNVPFTADGNHVTGSGTLDGSPFTYDVIIYDGNGLRQALSTMRNWRDWINGAGRGPVTIDEVAGTTMETFTLTPGQNAWTDKYVEDADEIPPGPSISKVSCGGALLTLTYHIGPFTISVFEH